jgi:hypothetical protein
LFCDDLLSATTYYLWYEVRRPRLYFLAFRDLLRQFTALPHRGQRKEVKEAHSWHFDW